MSDICETIICGLDTMIEHCREKLAELGPDETIQVNAPVALMQVDQKAYIRALETAKSLVKEASGE